MEYCILSIDQGTTNTKAIAVNIKGEIIARSSQPIGVHYPHAAWVEQDAIEIWQSTSQVIARCLTQLSNCTVQAIAITNQRESVALWERATGKPVGPSVTWQCRRSGPLCDRLADEGMAPRIHQLTGLQLDPGFSAGKIAWLLDNTPDGYTRAAAGELCTGTIDSWLLWNLTGGRVHACDVSNASRTQLMHLQTLDWDDSLLDYFSVPRAVLPVIFPSAHVFGYTDSGPDIPAGLPVASMIGDSHAALYGHAGFMPGTIKTTYGTGSSLMTTVQNAHISPNGISTTVAWSQDTQITYALEGNISVTGAAVQWIGDLLRLDPPGLAVEQLARQVSDNGGVYFVPAFVGLGAPHWDPDARGLMTGITRGTQAGHLARATLESIAYQVRDVFDVMAHETEAPFAVLLADGGASKNDLLMQFQADILGCPVVRSASSDVSALGAAYLAGITTGFWASQDEIRTLPRAEDRFEVRFTPTQRERLYADWQIAVSRAKLKPAH
ncbi:MAG: glycerol kinase GlpK [Anaerolineae bacterium]|nr:glycerol kinase GlpK [Anaerolineae bacterium]